MEESNPAAAMAQKYKPIQSAVPGTTLAKFRLMHFLVQGKNLVFCSHLQLGKQRVEGWKGLETECLLQIKFEDIERPARDVAISGLGWRSVEPLVRSFRNSDINLEAISRELHLPICVPRPVEVFVRSPMPVVKLAQNVISIVN